MEKKYREKNVFLPFPRALVLSKQTKMNLFSDSVFLAMILLKGLYKYLFKLLKKFSVEI